MKAQQSGRYRLDLILWLAATASVALALYFALLFAPTERTMGHVQRIFYFHVASAWVAFLAFFVVFVASVLYLATRDLRHDVLAASSAEIGVLFTTLVLTTGPLWAKPVWNTYWTWDPRLTTTLILWLIYIAYLMLRSFVGEDEKAARFAAVFGIVGFADVPIVYLSIRLWRTLHPKPVIGGAEGSGLHPTMLIALLVCLTAFALLYLCLLRLRIRLERVQRQLRRAQLERG
ncbi:MAG: cytochrome c biogenesis protein [candidate division KSB1 bacterium]|nr:cytochrome c biogenesis protein [candidate division KSB1 bacterium]